MPAKKKSKKKTKKKTKKKKVAKKKVAKRPAPYRVLALDGGGIRGLITAVWLEALEKRLQKEHGQSLNESFDLIAGTSTGSILACAVSAGIPAREVRQMYIDDASTIFPGRMSRIWSRAARIFSDGPSAPKYDGDGLEMVLRNRFGDTRFGDLKIQPTLVTTYNTLTRTATVMKNTRPRFADLRVWEVTKASASAPTYFPAQVLTIDHARSPFIDGGVVANNPTACAIAEAVRESNRALDNIVVASFGTGKTTRAISIEEAQEWGALEWAIPVIDVLMDGASDSVEYVASQLIPEANYFRFQTPLDDAYDDLDNADRTNLNALQTLASSYLRTREAKRKYGALIPKLRTRTR